MSPRRTRLLAAVACVGLLAGCSSSSSSGSTSVDVTGTSSATATSDVAASNVLVGAASRSVLPTVGGNRDYVSTAPGWSNVDPYNPGVYVPAFDQGAVDVGNGNNDAAWVHDDLKATAVAIQEGDSLVVLVTADVYMVFAVDAAEIEAMARKSLPAQWKDSAKIIVSATHNHHGPDTAFSVNDKWYETMAAETAATVNEAVAALEPATLAVASGEHRYGMNDVRDPVVFDPALNVLVARSTATDDVIATVVQWASHPETTLGFEPKTGFDISAVCTAKGWTDDDCKADGRYFTSDYPGVLRDVVSSEIGGEVMYFNGPLGSQIGPGQAPTWVIDAEHPEGNGWVVPAGAKPLPGATDYLGRSFAKTESIGTQLGLHVLQLVDAAEAITVPALVWREQPFYTRLTNIGFRVLLADGDLGWKTPLGYNCTMPFSDATCVSDDGKVVDDPVLTPLVQSQIRVADVLKTRLVHLSLGSVGFLFMPGELPPELVVGLPADFVTATDKYYRDANEEHARGADYATPGYLLDLVDEPTTFTVGLGGDELGYWVPLNEVKVRCAAEIIGPPDGCKRAFEAGVINTVDGVSGPICKKITDDPSSLDGVPADLAKVALDSCRYGQALGRELGEPPGHYEETNSAGWDLVDDTWKAAVTLFGRDNPRQINPDNKGYTPESPPPTP